MSGCRSPACQLHFYCLKNATSQKVSLTHARCSSQSPTLVVIITGSCLCSLCPAFCSVTQGGPSTVCAFLSGGCCTYCQPWAYWGELSLLAPLRENLGTSVKKPGKCYLIPRVSLWMHVVSCLQTDHFWKQSQVGRIFNIFINGLLGWGDRVHLWQICRWCKTGRSDWCPTGSCCHPQGPGQAAELGRQELLGDQQRVMQGPVLGEE